MTTMIALGRLLRQRLDGDEVDFSAMPILKLLAHQGPLRISALAGQLALDASTVSRHVSQLESKGLVVRADDPDDRRASRVEVSDHGARCLDAAASRRRAMIARVLDGWSDRDREQLRLLLTRFHTDLQEHR